jgi:hypothetical protein
LSVDFPGAFGEEMAKMKVIRVPWIRCRADEAGAQVFEMQWRKQIFRVLAYSEGEAREWWDGLSEAERRPVAGLADDDDQMGQTSLF